MNNDLRVVFYEVDKEEPFEKHAGLLPLISNERRSRIDRINNNALKNVLLMSEMTIIRESAKDLGVAPSCILVRKTELGKPYIEGFPNYHISLSHCEGMIAFACASAPIGIDIEKERKNCLSLAKRFFTENEYNRIIESEDQKKEFLLVWTRKEAYVKMTGQGLSVPLSSFDVYEAGGPAYVTGNYHSAAVDTTYTYSYVTGSSQ